MTALYKKRIGWWRSELFKMNALLVVSVACLFAVSAVQAETYSAEYDNLDVEDMLNNEDKLRTFGRCLLDEKVCSANALLLKG